MAKFLLDALRESGDAGKGKNLFDNDVTSISYKTGVPILDYYLGYTVNVYNEDNEIVDTYPSIGIAGGSYITVIGKSSTAKTSTIISLAANIIRPFDSGLIMHFDLEQAMSYSRVQAMTKFTMTEMRDKYLLKNEYASINDIKAMVMKVYFEKTQNPDKYKYNTRRKNEFGEDIIAYVPTVVIIDSIPSLSSAVNEGDKKDVAKLEEVSSQTEKMRLTAEIGRFYTELLPYIKKANIIVFSVNHIKVNPGMGIVKSPAELLYLKQDEALPGGKAPQYLAHILWKHVAIGSEKYTKEDNGFDGFGIRIEIIKCRSNQAGQSFTIVYDKVHGIDSLRTSLAFAKEYGLITGDKNHTRFLTHPDMKFSMLTVHEYFDEHREMYKVLYDNIIPVLETKLSTVTSDEMKFIDDEMSY